jgi:homoserine kinase
MSVKSNLSTCAYAPASIGNVNLGFDVLGAALSPINGALLGDSVTVKPLRHLSPFSLTVGGEFADKLPTNIKENIVTQCFVHFASSLKAKSVDIPNVAMHLEKRLPIGSGLGSSASSIVAAFHALNSYFDDPFNETDLLLMMGQLEGQISGGIHYDNVAPCYLGGMTLMTGDDAIPVTQLPLLDDWYWTVSFSGLSISTASARGILPKQYPTEDVLTFGRQLGVFVDALHRQDSVQAARVMHDVIAEPYRKSLLPEFDQARIYSLQNGADAFGISGSGPTVFAVSNSLEKANVIGEYLQSHYVQNNNGFTHVCTLCQEGARIEHQQAS